MDYKRIIIAASLSLSMCVCAYAQSAKDLLREDISRAANLHHSYEVPASLNDTPAPRGYKPFYLSHYGRHGSRYHTSIKNVTKVSYIMDTLYNEGLLTNEGIEVWKDLKAIEKEHEGQDGYLTQKGAAEHRGISQRLYARVPGLFKQKDRNEVMAASTAVQRCIQSMANFCVQLKGNAPDLKLSIYAGPKYADYICNTKGETHDNDRTRAIADSVLNAVVNPDRAMTTWFKDPQKAAAHFPKGDKKFYFDVFYAGALAQCLDMEDVGFWDHFTFNEIYDLWYYNDVTSYNGFCNSIEGNRGNDIVGRRILRDVIDKADEALAPGSKKAADLRFGHDSGLAPLISLLRLEIDPGSFHMADAPEGVWYGFQGMPMGSNLQLIFYKNKKGDVLVKILRNEEETTIPALPTYSGPYYKWSDLRAYFVSLMQ